MNHIDSQENKKQHTADVMQLLSTVSENQIIISELVDSISYRLFGHSNNHVSDDSTPQNPDDGFFYHAKLIAKDTSESQEQLIEKLNRISQLI